MYHAKDGDTVLASFNTAEKAAEYLDSLQERSSAYHIEVDEPNE